ncbi:MAG: ATP-binding protein [Pseudomonadota bacterium]|nr:ATP-binding protein [Pseudomonadota bacterium]
MSGIEGDAAAPDEPKGAWRTAMLVVMAALGVVVLVALIWTLGEANRQRDRALQLQRHSYEVMILARTLAGTIAQAEASLGRYVISTDKSQGQKYSEQWQLASDQLDRLDDVTNDNPAQQPRIDELRHAFEIRGNELSMTALATSYGKNAQALARFYAARQGTPLTRINELLEEIINREHALLDARTNDAMASVSRSNMLASVLAVFGVLLVCAGVGLGWVTVRVLAQRAVAEQETELERERGDELEAAVERATGELRAQAERMRQIHKMEAVGQLTGGIAHDFNNMLAVVIGGLELAQRQLDSPSDDARRHIDSAMEGANRAAALTRRLLAFSREEALRTEPIDSGALIAAMSDLLDRTIGDTILVDVADHAGGWMTRCDALQLENVILNLAVNARDAMNGRGTLTIATSALRLAEGEIGTCRAGDYVAVTVTDTGCGMTAETLERVFEPFFTTKPSGKGTGLGLSQVFAFARQAGGEVDIRSRPGEGASVTLYLPRIAGADRCTVVTDIAAAPPAAPASATLDIVVVEDDPRVLAATMGALEELGHRAVACDDPLNAEALLNAQDRIDLIISDVLMPGRTGPEMIAALPAPYARVGVLFVTGYAGDAGGEVEFGGRPVLRKPFTIAALERAIAEAMTSVGGSSRDSIAAE